MSPYFTSLSKSPQKAPEETTWAASTPPVTSTRRLNDADSRINVVFDLFKAGNLETAQIMAEELLLRQPDLTVYHRAPLHSMLGLYPYGVGHAEKASQIYRELSLIQPEFKEAYQNARVAFTIATKVEALWEAHEMKMLKRKTHTRQQIRHDRYQLFYYSAFEHTRKDKIKDFLEATAQPATDTAQPASDSVSQVLPDPIWQALLNPASKPSSEPVSPPTTPESKEKSDGDTMEQRKDHLKKSEITEKKTAGSSKSRRVVSEKNSPYSYGVFEETNNQTNGQTKGQTNDETNDLHDRVVDHLIKRSSSNLFLGNMMGSPVYGLKSSEVYVRNTLPRKSISRNSPTNNSAV